MSDEFIYRVAFKVPPLLGVNDRKEFYFHSLAAYLHLYGGADRLQSNTSVEHRGIARKTLRWAAVLNN